RNLRQRRQGEHRIPAVVMVEDQAEGRRRPSLAPLHPDLEEEPDDEDVEPAHDPIAGRDLDAQLSRTGASRALGRVHQATALLASSVPPRAGSATRRRAHAPITSSMAMSTKIAR